MTSSTLLLPGFRANLHLNFTEVPGMSDALRLGRLIYSSGSSFSSRWRFPLQLFKITTGFTACVSPET